MSKKWYNHLVSADGGSDNIADAAGAVLLLSSALLPWVRVPERLAVRPVAGAEMALAAISGGEYYSPGLALCVFLAAGLGLYTLLSRKARRVSFLAATVAVVSGVSAYLLPMPLLLPGFGLYTAGGGLLLLMAGFFTRRA